MYDFSKAQETINSSDNFLRGLDLFRRDGGSCTAGIYSLASTDQGLVIPGALFWGPM
jgi:hypothetical protein